MIEEKRRPRQSFTRALKNIADRIDSHITFEAEYYNSFLHKKERVVFRVNALWAFGSWAKGALDCGDLDLMADISMVEGFMPFESVIRRVLVKRARDVRLYIGTPEKNSSRAIIEDAILIWSPENRDWKANIAGIKSNPAIKRFQRKTDIIPLRNEQLYAEIDAIEAVVDLREKGILDWSWVPFPEKEPEIDKWTSTSKKAFERISNHSGVKTATAMKHVINWFEKNEPIRTWKFDNDNRAAFWINGKRIHVGRPCLDQFYIDHHSCSGIMLVPHITKRGPNGIWHIRRGKEHPLEKMFLRASGFTIVGSDGKPDIIEAISGWESVNLIEMFRSCKDAEEFLEDISEDLTDDCKIGKISSKDLLNAISCVDQLSIDWEFYAITIKGTRFDGEKFGRPKPEELMTLLNTDRA